MLILTFLIGFLMNFIGYVPLGNINLTVVKLAINRGMRQVWYFLIAFSLVELIFTFCIMKFAEWFSGQANLLNILDWVLIVVFLTMGTITWKNHNQAPKEDFSRRDSIKLGILLGFVNPMQLPFWLIGGTYVISKGWILTGNTALLIFSIGSAVGSFLCLYSFAHFARYIQNKFSLSSHLINRSIAILLFVLAFYYIVKLALRF
jgi:threonine/homoserine/homoserine lactone efflux protein